MRPDLPWNVAGISAEAREAARAAARREGLSVGEWLTRRIVSGLTEPGYVVMNEARSEWPAREYRAEPDSHADRQRRESDAMLDRVSKSEAETADVYRRIEEQMRTMARRLDASERSQSESNRVISKAAVEMNITAREQSQAFEQLGSQLTMLAERLGRVEGRESGEGMREAVKALHQGLSRLADQISETANQSAQQISNLANNLETVAGRVSQARQDALAATQAMAESLTQSMEARLAVLDERVKSLETTSQATSASLSRALDAVDAQKRQPSPMEAIERLEDSVRRLEENHQDPALDRRLSGLERNLADVTDRLEDGLDDKQTLSGVEDHLKKLVARLDALEETQRDAASEWRAFAERDKPREELPPQIEPVAPPPFTPPPMATAAFTPPPLASASAAAASFTPPPAAAFGPLPGYDVPPPVAEPPLAPPPTFTDPLPNYEIPAEAFVPPQSDVPPTVESYLAAARRSARAAAAQEAERSGNLRWGSTAKAKPEKTQKTRPLVAFLVALIAIFVIVGAVLSRQNTKLMVPPQPVAQKAMPPAPDLHASSEGEAKSVAEASAQAPAHTGPANAAITAPASATPANLKPMNAAAPEPSKPAPQLAALPPQNQMNARAPLDRLTQAANGGNAKAQLIVGLKYLEHDGVPENFTEAAKWLGKAAEAGEPVAQYRLGTMFERGRGVPADVAKAIRWYQAAANQGNRKAMHNLAVAFTDGPSKNYTEASRWFLKAANLGLSDSQFNLAVLYERGLGVPQNLVDAYKWYAIAAAQGDGESKSRLNAIASQLDSEARAAAQHAADVFRPGQLDARANVAPTVGDVTRG